MPDDFDSVLMTMSKPVVKDNFTRDFRVLPAQERIRELIEDDVNKEIARIAELLIKSVESGRGRAHCRYAISQLHRDRVIKGLKKWAKTFGYKINIDGELIDLTLNGLARNKQSVCKHCGRRSKTFNRVLRGLTGSIACVSIPVLVWFGFESGFATAMLSMLAAFAMIPVWVFAMEWDG